MKSTIFSINAQGELCFTTASSLIIDGVDQMPFSGFLSFTVK